MTAAIILVVALIALGATVALYSYLRNDAAMGEAKPSGGGCATCDGTNTKCEQECMMEASTQPIVYYDDEELDQFKGREPDDYTDEEVEMFRDVLYTMRQDEAAGWNRSLLLRGINVPNVIKDELVMMIGG